MMLTLLSLAFCQSLLFAEEIPKPLPKFEEALPSEKFFNKQPLPVGHTYGFATNKTLKELKPLLLSNLGEGWDLKIAPPDELAKMNKRQDFKMENAGQLVHEDFPNHSIGVTLIKMPKNDREETKGYSKILSIVTVDMKKAAEIDSKKSEEKSE